MLASGAVATGWNRLEPVQTRLDQIVYLEPAWPMLNVNLTYEWRGDLPADDSITEINLKAILIFQIEENDSWMSEHWILNRKHVRQTCHLN